MAAGFLHEENLANGNLSDKERTAEVAEVGAETGGMGTTKQAKRTK
jgi:hypothetical protein